MIEEESGDRVQELRNLCVHKQDVESKCGNGGGGRY